MKNISSLQVEKKNLPLESIRTKIKQCTRSYIFQVHLNIIIFTTINIVFLNCY
jgi:hypothetical protein